MKLHQAETRGAKRWGSEKTTLVTRVVVFSHFVTIDNVVTTLVTKVVVLQCRDIYDMCFMLRDVIPMLRPHTPGCGSLLVDVYDM